MQRQSTTISLYFIEILYFYVLIIEISNRKGGGVQMVLTEASVRALVALVQARLSSMRIFDREDSRERKSLQACLEELQKMRQPISAASVQK
jgi:hypothetical protein